MIKAKTTRTVLTLVVASLLLLSLSSQFANAITSGDPELTGTIENPSDYITAVTMGSIIPVVTETGKIALSVDGAGSNSGTAIIEVEKPSASATVRCAYMAAATTGLRNYHLVAGNIKIDGANFVWSIETSSSISSWNYWGDVTNLVKPKIDAAPAGRISFTVTESSTGSIDGEILVVIFDDPAAAIENTIVLLFGAQAVGGDTFHIGLGSPITAEALTQPMELSLGISFGYQPTVQYSVVEVNGQRISTSAGGQDDGAGANGALLTVGGLDDSNANPPNPLTTGTAGPAYDDELYTLNPFVEVGDTTIDVFTKNPSNDDNIFFAALNLRAQTAVVNEGIVLSPPSAGNTIGQPHTVTATLQDSNGEAIVGRMVTFEIISGPNTGNTAMEDSDASGHASYTYNSATEGTDVIRASFINNQGETVYSNTVTKTWSPLVVTNLYLSMNAPVLMADGSSMTCTIYYNNFGGNPAQNTVLKAQLPPEVVFISASDSGTYNSALHQVDWNIGTIPPEGNGYRTVTVGIPSGTPIGTVLHHEAEIQTTTLETDFSDNIASKQTTVVHSQMPTNTEMGPVISYSNQGPIINWHQPITFTYIDPDAIAVDIIIHVNDGGDDITGTMTGPAPTWTYTTTFYPRHGWAMVTYIPHYPSGTTNTIDFTFYIDPAGYVYDVITNDRIQGATVWLQWYNTVTGNWENVPTGESPAVMQPDVNPLVTNVDGQYQWDTLAGSYRVHVEAPGYYPADSIVVTVPPPVFDLNVGLTPLPVTYAASASVWTTNDAGVELSEFGLGQTVYIHWHPSPDNTVVDIQVQDQDGNVVFGPALTLAQADSPVSFTPPFAGYFTVLVNGAPAFHIAVSTLFVVPESALGTLMATIACLAAAVTLHSNKHKHKKP